MQLQQKPNSSPSNNSKEVIIEKTETAASTPSLLDPLQDCIQPQWRPNSDPQAPITYRISPRKVLLHALRIGGGLAGLFLLPTYLMASSGGCAGKARLTEARHNLGATNRAQTAFYLENGRFANSWDSLGLGIATETTNYQFSTNATKTAAYSYGLARNNKVKTYVAATFLLPTAGKLKPINREPSFTSVICEATKQGPYKPELPTLENGNPICPTGTKILAMR